MQPKGRSICCWPRLQNCLPKKLSETHGSASWTGQALLRVNERAQARVWLGHSYTAFEAVGDSSGMRLAAANVVTAFGLECGDLRDLDLWIERHTRAGGDTPVEANEQFETSLLMGIMCAAFVAGRYPPQIQSDVFVAG